MSKKNSNTFWDNEWLESQRRFFETWMMFTQPNLKNGTGASKEKNPFSDVMDYWWKNVSTSLPEGSSEFVTKMMEQSKFFYMLSEQFTKLLNNINEFNKTSDEWQLALNKQFEEMKKMFTSSHSDTKETMHGIMGAWQLLPMDTLQRAFSSASIMPGDFLEDLKPDVLQSVTDKFLSIPGVGYTRESQEQFQTGIRFWNDYLKNYKDYNNAMCKVSVNALDAMRIKIIEMAEQGREINSLREIYDLWVDCNEDAYAIFVNTDEFSELYGRLTNSLMAVKHHGRNMIDEALSALNMPTRHGMNTLQKRQQEMRREIRGATSKIENLQNEIAAVRKSASGGILKSNEKHDYSSNVKKDKDKDKDKRIVARKPARKERKKMMGSKVKPARKIRYKNHKKDDMIVIKI